MTGIIDSGLHALHILAWMFLVFGGWLVPGVAKWNLLVLLPSVYLLHILPFHFMVRAKVRRLAQDYDARGEDRKEFRPIYLPRHRFRELRKEFSGYVPGASKRKVNAIVRAYKADEYSFVLPKMLDTCHDKFLTSYANPLSPQGLVILGFILNSYRVVA